ncbi:cell wall-binding repeat-containing protein [Microbacterium sp.]|uniref:cell wall-binding repeat-containing protein n=1 Tax=Microbacterium sp. TaxID=51671 RepID=UPI0025D0DA0B|nr:cell wall-binding repeat-containing protein [Microbacterium sp.]
MRRITRIVLTAALVGALSLSGSAASAAIIQIDDSARDPELSIGSTGWSAKLYRFQGADRVETARVAASLTDYATSGTSLGDVALLAASTGYADALASAPLAESLSAPVLLANADGTVSPAVSTELARYDTVVIVSGRGLIPEKTAGALRAKGTNVVRYAGTSRFDTAAALGLASLYWGSVRTGGGRHPAASIGDWTAYIADGLDFPDGLAAGPAAARDGNGVVLLTAGAEVGPVTDAAVHGRFAEARGVDTDAFAPLLAWWATASRGAQLTTNAVGAAAASAAGGAGIPLVSSFVGRDRYETAALVAKSSLERGIATNSFAIASGESFPDAVVAGAFAANASSPLLLSRATALPASTVDVLSASVLNDSVVVVFGGEATLSRGVSRQLIEQLSW